MKYMENTVKIKKSHSISDILIIMFIGVLAVITIFPFYNVVIVSFASMNSLAEHNLYLLPYAFDLTGYINLIKEESFYRSFLISTIVTVVGVSFNMLLSVSGAYALSKKGMPGRNIFLGAILFTMFFNGGLIPYYLVVQSLGLVNSIWAMIIPTGVSTTYLIIMKNYFNTLPESIEESAKIDGANDLVILIKIILPISKPFIATFLLFYAVDRWNDWWYALIFISDTAKAPLQIFLREMLINFNTQLNSSAQAVIDQSRSIFVQTTQMATIVISAIPMLCIYPFLQKHFAKGIMIGSIKE